MVYVTLRFDGLPAQILENAIKNGIAKTKTQAVTLGLLKLNEEYHLADDNEEFDMPRHTVELFEELIEKSIKTGNIVSEKKNFFFFFAEKEKKRSFFFFFFYTNFFIFLSLCSFHRH